VAGLEKLLQLISHIFSNLERSENNLEAPMILVNNVIKLPS